MPGSQEIYINAILHFLEKVPVAGEAVTFLQETVFHEDNWDEIRGKTEALVDARLADADYLQLKLKMNGLQASLNLYLTEVRTSKDTPSQIGNVFNDLHMRFVAEIPYFKDARYQSLLLPLFVQVITMYLTVLRDGCIHGSAWGFSAEKVEALRRELKQSVDYDNGDSYISYARSVGQKTIDKRRTERHELWQNRKGGNRKECVRFFTYFSKFQREFVIDVMDVIQLWPVFEVSAEAGIPLAANYRNRFVDEIYSDAYGGGVAEIPDPERRSSADVTSVTVWSVYRLSATPEIWVSSLRDVTGGTIPEVGMPPAPDAVQEGPVEGPFREILVNRDPEINPERYARLYGIKFIAQSGHILECGSLNHSRRVSGLFEPDEANAESIPVPPNHHISSIHATGRPGFIDTIYLGFRRNRPPTPIPPPAAVQRGAAIINNLKVLSGLQNNRSLLSCTRDGTRVDLFNTDDESGRQQWTFSPVEGYPEEYNIIVSGGVTGDRKFLSCTPDGGEVNLWREDDGSGRQRWKFLPVKGSQVPEYHNIKVARGVTSDRVYLSCTRDGTRVDLFNTDDESGRQRWQTQPIRLYYTKA
jgi:hypothetical protein